MTSLQRLEVCMAILVLFYPSLTSNTCTQLDNLPLQRGVRLPGFEIDTMTTDGVMTCVRSCLTRKWCKSFNFDTSSGMCELNYARLNPGDLNVTSLVSAPDYVFSDVTQWPQKLAGACSSHSCAINTYCQPMNDSFYVCVIYVKPTSCAEVKECDPTSIDGEYWIRLVTFDLYRTRIYCYNMSTTDPKEYLTLPNPNYGVYPEVSNENCSGETALQCVGEGGEMWYHKIRVHLKNMKVNRGNGDFANFTNVMVYFANARDCYTAHYNDTLQPCGTKGRFTVDLRGTGWAVPPELQWKTGGSQSVIESVSRNTEGTIIHLKCGGFSGFCHPDGPLKLIPNPTEMPEDSAADVPCSL